MNWKDGLTEMQRRRTDRAPERQEYYNLVLFAAVEIGQLRGRVLDVGCGDGSARFLLRDSAYVGIDPCPIESPEFDFHCGKAEELPFGDASFDGVLCYSVLQHVEDPEKALREIARVTRPGGRVCLMVCAESEDKLFLQAFRFPEVLTLIDGIIRMDSVRVMRGYGRGDGRYVIVAGWRD